MILRKTNIHDRLIRAKDKNGPSEEAIFKQVIQILEDTSKQHERIENNLVDQHRSSFENTFDHELLERDRIFHIDVIRQICIDYRLRFLDSNYFKGEIPVEAISKINELEKKHGGQLTGFKIMAPSKLFKLKDKDDPLLFIPMGNDFYYLVHKWGNDLHALRKLLMWPFKSVVNLTLLVVFISYLITLMVPEGLFSKNSSLAEFMIMFFFMFKCIASVVIFYGFALGKNFNPQIWRSKYFNA
ncbi:hypothetical protein ACEZ3G_11715 [Maribacter algicola]|uniref:Uncharacterized protein n=1 Tax=Meishania litoralis TaxID=3434685 RepID=A0ACC7LKV2_9FLAO